MVDIRHNRHVSEFLILMKHKGITLRHIAFGSGILVFLWTTYYTLFRSRSTAFNYNYDYTPTQDRILRPAVDVGKEEWAARAEQVKAAFVHTYRGYEKHAWGFDEIKPVSKEGTNKYVRSFSSTR